MMSTARHTRRLEIMQAAYELVAETGYGGTSMLAVAKRARASNETLYKWFGDKRGLFAEMVRENARHARELLSDSLSGAPGLHETLDAVGPVLLSMVTGERAIALNRAAAADPTGTLGRLIAEGGRDAIQPMILAAMERGCERGELRQVDPHEVAEVYIGLLIGDLQVRRVIGARPEPGHEEITGRARRATDLLFVLYGQDEG